jgi:hypothetical protein
MQAESAAAMRKWPVWRAMTGGRKNKRHSNLFHSDATSSTATNDRRRKERSPLQPLLQRNGC